MKVTILTTGLALALLGAAHSGVKAAPAAKVSPAQAKAAAVKKIPGKALSAKYEFEDGHWQYAVMVQKGKTLYEVEVNSVTGRVTDTEKTTPAEEKAEAAADKKTAMSNNTGQKTMNAAKLTEKAGTEKAGTEKAGTEKAGAEDDDKK